MIRKVILVMAALMIAAPLLNPAVAEDQTIGRVTGVKGEAFVKRPGMGKVKAGLGLGIVAGDTIITEKGRIKILMDDDIILSLAAKSEVLILKYGFDRQREKRQTELDFPRGLMKLLVSKSPEMHVNVRVNTPNASVEVSGTAFYIEHDYYNKVTHLLTSAGQVGIKSTDETLPGLFRIGAGEITTVYDRHLPSQPRTASKQEIAAYWEKTYVADQINLSKMPGRSGNMIDNPAKGYGEGAGSNAIGNAISPQSEGEGGAEFDAFDVHGDSSHLSDSDLPLPGDVIDDIQGGPISAGFNDDPVVKVKVVFEDDSDKKD